MKQLKKMIKVSAGVVMIAANIIPIYASDITNVDSNTVRQVCQDQIKNAGSFIQQTVDNISIETHESVSKQYSLTEVSSVPVTYTYVEQESYEQTMTMDEFMTLYGSIMEENPETEEALVSTSEYTSAYDQALANYNSALAEYETASQMIESTKEVEVEIIEEVTDEYGNISEITRTEIQTVTELVPAGDVVAAQANLDAAKMELDKTTPSANTEYNFMETMADISKPESIDEIDIQDEPQYQASTDSIGENLEWTITDDTHLLINGNGDMNDFDFNTSPWGEGIYTVTMGEGVTSIGNYAFSKCKDLREISLPESLTRIGNSAFSSCSNLTSIIIPNNVTTIGEDAFFHCTSLTDVKISDSLTSLGVSAFSRCDSLYSITIPEGITRIEDYTFYYCTNLTYVTLPNTLTSIGINAFNYCRLTSITVPDGVTSIGVNAFLETSFIHDYEGDFVVLGKGILYQYKGTDSEVIIPNTVSSIGSAAFRNCIQITGITIPETVTSIASYAFSQCSNLKSIIIPDSVTTIDHSAFYYCTGLTDVHLGNGLTNLANNTFYFCTDLTSITISDSVNGIGNLAFFGCSGLTSITISDSVNSIGNNAFMGCTNLKDVYYEGTEKEWKTKNLYNFGENVTIHFLGLPFEDVPKDAWYYDVAKECYETGLINGTSATTFSPMQEMTRAMVVTILWRMEGQPKVDFNNKFSDVSSSQWYATSISWAEKVGVVHGYGDGTFKPDAAVTREQVAVMLANYATYKGVYVPGTKKLNTYPDGSQVSTWAQAGMKWALTNGIISGNGEGYLRPKKNATRAEGAAMLLRMKNWL